jgi:hypothetical protein
MTTEEVKSPWPWGPITLTVNQVVSFNLRRAREEERKWTQTDAGVALHKYLGEYWSRQRWSAAERVYTGETSRDFTVNELIAFCRTFELPLSYFFAPPPLCLHVITGLPTWLVYFEDDPETGAMLFGMKLEEALRDQGSRRIAKAAGPHPNEEMPAQDLLQFLGRSESPVAANQLRNLASDLLEIAENLEKGTEQPSEDSQGGNEDHA